ncbi:MAG: hypothetical protein WCT15_05475, partial [Candidatus Omnitrophota bacterium]
YGIIGVAGNKYRLLLDGYTYKDQIANGDTVEIGDISYKVTVGANGIIAFAEASRPALTAEDKNYIELDGRIYEISRAESGDYILNDGTFTFKTHSGKVAIVTGEGPEALDGTKTFAGFSVHNYVAINGVTYDVIKIADSDKLCLEQIHWDSTDVQPKDIIKVDETEYLVSYDASKGVYVFTKMLSGEAFESSNSLRSVRLEDNVAYDIVRDGNTGVISLVKVYASQGEVDGQVEINGNTYKIERRGLDTYDLILLIVTKLPGGGYTTMPDPSTVLSTSYEFGTGKHVLITDSGIYDVSAEELATGAEVARFAERSKYYSTALAAGAGIVGSATIGGMRYNINRIITATYTTYSFIGKNDLGMNVTYYADDDGLLRIGKVSYKVALEAGARLSITRQFKSVPKEAAVMLKGKILRVEYDILLGKYRFYDGYNEYRSSDDRRTISVDGVLYDISRDAATNTLILSEQEPENTEARSSFGKKFATLTNDGTTMVKYSITKQADGTYALASASELYSANAAGRVKVGTEIYLISETSDGELLFTRLTRSEAVAGDVIGVGKDYIEVNYQKNSKVTNADVNKLIEYYAAFDSLDMNGDGILDQADVDRKLQAMEANDEKIADLRSNLTRVNYALDKMYWQDRYHRDELKVVYQNAQDDYNEYVKLYRAMNLGGTDRYQVVAEEDADEIINDIMVDGVNYEVTRNGDGTVWTLTSPSATYTVSSTDQNVRFGQSPVTFNASVQNGGKMLILERNTSFGSDTSKPVYQGADLPISIHGVAYEVKATAPQDIEGQMYYKFEFKRVSDSKVFTSVLRGKENKVWIDGFKFLINDRGVGFKVYDLGANYGATSLSITHPTGTYTVVAALYGEDYDIVQKTTVIEDKTYKIYEFTRQSDPAKVFTSTINPETGENTLVIGDYQFAIYEGPSATAGETQKTVKLGGKFYVSDYTSAAGGQWVMSEKESVAIQTGLTGIDIGSESYSAEYTTANGGEWTLKDTALVDHVIGKDYTTVTLGSDTYSITRDGLELILETKRPVKQVNASDTQTVIDGTTYLVSVSGTTLTMTENTLKISETGVIDPNVYMTSESASNLAKRVLMEILADRAGPSNSTVPDGKVDINDVLYFKKTPFDLSLDGVIDEMDLNLIWATIEFDQDAVYTYDFNANDRIDNGDVTAYQTLASANTGINLDLNGDGKTNDYDITFIKEVVAYENARRTIREGVDKNSDRIIGEDERKAFEEVVMNAQDLNNDGYVNTDDLAVFGDIKTVTDAIETQYGTGKIALYDLNEDGIVNYEDTKEFEAAYASVVDITGDGSVNTDDDYALTRIIDGGGLMPDGVRRIINLPQYYLPESAMSKADFNKDGDITTADFDGWSDFDRSTIGGSSIPAGDVINLRGFKSQPRSSSDQRYMLTTEEMSGYFEYEAAFDQTGIYDFALTVKSSKPTLLKFRLYVDGVYSGVVTTGASDTMFSTPHVLVNAVGDGQEHVIRFEMENMSQVNTTVSIEDFIVTDPVPSAYDINNDGKVTEDDGRLVTEIIKSQAVINMSDVNHDGRLDIDDMNILDPSGAGTGGSRDIDANEAKLDQDGDTKISQREIWRDIDGDGKVTNKDLSILSDMLTTISYIERSDVNNDKFIDIKDLAMLRSGMVVTNQMARVSAEYTIAAMTVDQMRVEMKAISDSMRTLPLEQALASDLNADGILDNRDIVLIQKYIGDGRMEEILTALDTMPAA